MHTETLLSHSHILTRGRTHPQRRTHSPFSHAQTHTSTHLCTLAHVYTHIHGCVDIPVTAARTPQKRRRSCPQLTQTMSRSPLCARGSRIFPFAHTHALTQMNKHVSPNSHPNTFTDMYTYIHRCTHTLIDTHSQIHTYSHKYPPHTYPHRYTHSSSQAHGKSTHIHRNTLIFRVRLPLCIHTGAPTHHRHTFILSVMHKTPTSTGVRLSYIHMCVCSQKYTFAHRHTGTDTMSSSFTQSDTFIGT